MPRLIEVQVSTGRLSPCKVAVGDVLLCRAAGGHIRSGEDVVEMTGPFVPSVVAKNGEVLTPMGPPNTVLLRARGPGRAQIELITGDPFHGPRKTTVLRLTVESDTTD